MAKVTDPYQPLQQLKVSGNLPVIPQILVQLIDACHQPEVDMQVISELVKKDAALAAKVLQLCNSAFIGARSSFIDIKQAVIYLGANAVKNLAISVSVQQIFRRVETNGLLNIDRFWYHSYQNAILAARIAEAVSYPNPPEAYLAGLLHDIGKLLLWMAFPGKYAPLLLKGIRCHNGRLAFLEQEKLQINHCDAGAWLTEQWGLPSLIHDSIRYHHHPTDEVAQGLPLTRIIFLADLISHSEDPEQECNEVADQFFRLAPGQLAKLQEGVDEQIREVAHQLGIRIPTRSKSALEPEPESESIHKETCSGLISRIRDITQLTGVMENLLKAGDLNQVARALEQSLKILFNEEVCFFLLLDRTTRELKGFCSDENRLINQVDSLRFDIERHRESLPARAIELGQLLHSFMNRPEGNDTLLDTQLTTLLGTEGMVLAPMTYRQQPVGLIVVGVSENTHLNLISHSTPLQLLAAQAAITVYMLQRKKEESERIAAERLEAASMLARKIAHEINNPLAILRNYIKILELKLKDQDDLREELATLDKEFERIGSITEQLSDIASEKHLTHMEKIDINKALEEITEIYTGGSLMDSDISITLQFDPDIPLLETDGNGLRQIITNLLNNAIDALEGKGSITVTTAADTDREKTGKVTITVADDGPGIEEDLKETLFQAGTTSKDGAHGGLGLAIVKKTVQELGGSIALVPSDAGATFSITLPTGHP